MLSCLLLYVYVSLLTDNRTMVFFQALLHSVPLGRLVIVDLFAEVKPIWSTSEQFYGVPYIWYIFKLLSLRCSILI